MENPKQKKQALRPALSRFTAELLGEAMAGTGLSHPKLAQRLNLDFTDTYRSYLREPTHRKSRLPLARDIQQLENNVAALLGRRAKRVVIHNLTEILQGEGWRNGPLRPFNVGEPGAIRLRGIPHQHLFLDYSEDEPDHHYLLGLLDQAKVWPRLVGMWQYDSEEDFNLDCQRTWLLTWQKRVQSAREKINTGLWPKYWSQLPNAFQAICDAQPRCLPVIPPIQSVPRPSLIDRTRAMLRQTTRPAGILPETPGNLGYFPATASNVTC